MSSWREKEGDKLKKDDNTHPQYIFICATTEKSRKKEVRTTRSRAHHHPAKAHLSKFKMTNFELAEKGYYYY